MNQAPATLQNNNVPTVSENEKKIRAFIEACLMVKPDLKDRITVAACIMYLQLPDSTFGWDAYKEQGKLMPIEYKFACLLPTLINDLAPGDICWLGNRPYARVEAYRTIAKRELGFISGLDYRMMKADEKEMYAIGEKDMGVIVEQKVSMGHQSFTIQGLGIIGDDESQPNQKGNYKVARQLVRDRAQFVRTRAERDMYRRILTIRGVHEEGPASEQPIEVVSEPVDLKTHFEEKKELETKAQDEALLSWVNNLSEKVKALGGDPEAIAPVDQLLAVRSSLLEEWIRSVPPTEPTDPTDKPKKTRAKKEKVEGSAPVVIGSHDGSPLSAVQIVEYPQNQIDETHTPEEIEDIVNMEPVLDDFEFPQEEPVDPVYEAIKEQKIELVKAMRAAGLPDDQSFFLALSGAMRGQPMSKVDLKVQALKQVHKAAPAPKPAPSTARAEFLKLTAKLTKLPRSNIDEVLGRNHMDILGNGTDQEVADATKKLEEWYTGVLTGKK